MPEAGLPYQYARWQEVITDFAGKRKELRKAGQDTEFIDDLIEIARGRRQEIVDDAVFIVGENPATARLQEINDIMAALAEQRQAARAEHDDDEDQRLTAEIVALRTERNRIIEEVMSQLVVRTSQDFELY